MGKRTGNPRGRPTGAKNKRTLALERVTRAVIARKDGEITSLELMQSIYRDLGQPLPLRISAAEKALPYEYARLAAVEHTGPDGGPVQVTGIEVVFVGAPKG